MSIFRLRRLCSLSQISRRIAMKWWILSNASMNIRFKTETWPLRKKSLSNFYLKWSRSLSRPSQLQKWLQSWDLSQRNETGKELRKSYKTTSSYQNEGQAGSKAWTISNKCLSAKVPGLRLMREIAMERSRKSLTGISRRDWRIREQTAAKQR